MATLGKIESGDEGGQPRWQLHWSRQVPMGLVRLGWWPWMWREAVAFGASRVCYWTE